MGNKSVECKCGHMDYWHVNWNVKENLGECTAQLWNGTIYYSCECDGFAPKDDEEAGF